ncbi:MAG TPA: TetR family transcriptional regulator [Dongiaceae bacterium]|jgi:AcrR family transcriptional regulator|nr:TetR family transcriptional regulator [Dongiaceae bacterium]
MAKRAKKTAAKSKRATRPASTARSTSTDPAGKLRQALLDLVEERGWIDLSMADIAEHAGVSLADAHRAYRSKAAILVGLTKTLDERLIEGLDADPLEGSAKDRLFDLLMRRFDILKADRDAYRRLMKQLPATPAEFAALLCRLRRSLSLMLEASGLSASGIKGELRLQGLGAVYTAGLRAFVNDESEDLSKTMAEVDKRLGQAERLSDMLSRRRPAAA